MFKSYEYSWGPGEGRYYEIIDEDFRETVHTADKYLFDVLIDVYERRALPVAPNLMRAFQCRTTWSINQLPSWMKFNTQMLRYKDELDKYLLLL